MLRHVGWPHPIQVWHRGAAEPVSERLRRLPGVEVVDAEAHPARTGRRTMGGWESKSFAIVNCPFEEVLFLDADCYPLFDPDECFAPELHRLGIASHRYAEGPLHAGDSLVLAGPNGRPLFVHRYCNKFGLAGDFNSPPRWQPAELPMEATAWRYFIEWLD
jgi:hypothetical protein